MNERIAAELSLLETVFPDIEFVEHGSWFLIPKYPVPPDPSWSPSPMRVAFCAKPGHPGQSPYGIYVPSGVRVDGQVPQRMKDPADQQPPFPGPWAVLSWQADGDEWKAHADIRQGSNLLNFALGIRERFSQGA